MPPSSRTLTRHEAILGALKDKILDGSWPPGHKLPFETDLALEFDVSRMTMNKVLTQLTREGFLVRRRRLGTFVATPRAQSAVMEITDIQSEVRALGLEYRWRLDDRATRPPSNAERSEIGDDADDAEILSLEGVHYAGRTPFCLEERLINLAAAPDAVRQDFSDTVPGTWLLSRIPWTAAEHRISAMNASGRVAEALALPEGEACLQVSRRTEIAGRWVTMARQTYPGARHQLLAQFEPRADG